MTETTSIVLAVLGLLCATVVIVTAMALWFAAWLIAREERRAAELDEADRIIERDVRARRAALAAQPPGRTVVAIEDAWADHLDAIEDRRDREMSRTLAGIEIDQTEHKRRAP